MSKFEIRFTRSVILLIGLLITSSSMYAQSFFVSGGYKANYMPLERANFVIDRFNETRTNLTDPMDPVHYWGGPAVSAGVGGSQAALILNYRNYHTETKGTWATASGDLQTTKVNLDANDYSISFGAVPGVGNSFAFGAGLEITILDSRISVVKPGESRAEEVERHFNLGFAPYAQFFIGITDNLYLYLKPSYTLDARFTDFYPLNKAINPATASQDKRISHAGKYNRLGIYAGITFAFDASPNVGY